MNLGIRRSALGVGIRFVAVVAAMLLCGATTWAQNRKNSWEVFLYFGGTYGHDIPSAIQQGAVSTYRVEPSFALDPNDPSQVYTPNLGLVGGHDLGQDPQTYPFVTNPSAQFGVAPCNNQQVLDPNDANLAAHFDECDNDQESLYRYNASGIQTNGEIQTDDSEFSLGLRAGYNITRHLEVEIDFGFGKQRVDLTQNKVDLLGLSINPQTDPNTFAQAGLGMTLDEARTALAQFYQFTWANVDYQSLIGGENAAFLPEHPFVYSSRTGSDPAYNINRYFPFETCTNPPCTPLGETYDDVTEFINRVLQDPTAFRSRGDQVNIDNFTISASLNWNFNTKADSRIIPYVGAGFGRWMRNFDNPWNGEDSNFMLGQAGIRFFVNEIFSFRADARYVSYLDDSFLIEAQLSGYNLADRNWPDFGSQYCPRDQPIPQPSAGSTCNPNPPPPPQFFPAIGNGGGNATVEVEAELDDFFEIRMGFDVILGGK